MTISRKLGHWPWVVIGTVGIIAMAMVAINRGEQVNAVWLLTAGVSVYLIAYRYYSRFIAKRVLGVDPERITPAHGQTDGLDYVPTNRYVLFGHHFAAIAGAGPLVGPVLAAQMGYLPGTLWILAGVVFAGAVQDFIILFISTRRAGRSFGELVRMELGHVAGIVALVGTFMIMVIILAVLALIVVKALADSPWGLFTVAATVPLALFMGAYTQWIRPARVGEASLVGLVFAIIAGQWVAASPSWAAAFTLDATTLCLTLIGYGAIASILPVWLLLAPRDYLSTFLKIGAIVALAVGIVLIQPMLRMPAITPFASGGGPVWSGGLFPFLFITIACGAVSGFHALIASGTTPKLIATESDLRLIGYGAMLMESFVALMAMIAASILDPAIYFTMNSPLALLGPTVQSAAEAVTNLGYPIAAQAISDAATSVGEHTIISRAGGAPTLAMGMAEIFSQLLGGPGMKAFWYHFAILFEALFILTAVDAGTRAGRFMLQDILAAALPRANVHSLGGGIIATMLCVGAWGYFLYQGATDPLGGINTLWPLFGIANQMLAAMALMLATVVLFRMKRGKLVFVTVIPAIWLVICTGYAGLLKLFSTAPSIGFLAHAKVFAEAHDAGQVLAPAKSLAQMSQIILNDRINAGICAFFLCVMLVILVQAIRACRAAHLVAEPSVTEIRYAKAAT